MVCRDCGKELDETNMVVGTSQETGEKVYFCTECFEKRSGVSIDTYERRKLIMKIVPFIALLATYLQLTCNLHPHQQRLCRYDCLFLLVDDRCRRVR